MPSTADKIWKQLNLEGDISKVDFDTEVQWGRLKPGIKINKGPALFPRMEKKNK
jgi:methionyl-tRNA synthetase